MLKKSLVIVDNNVYVNSLCNSVAKQPIVFPGGRTEWIISTRHAHKGERVPLTALGITLILPSVIGAFSIEKEHVKV